MLIQCVNFFGHAAVATWSDLAAEDLGAVVLGAMLPDFESMCGARVASTADQRVERGIALHHQTDAIFHRLPIVTGLMRELDALLEREACARGPRRAVAHIGMELLLDGALLDDDAYRAAYVQGLAHDAPLAWRAPDDDARFATLLARLRTRGVPEDLRSVDAVALRLQRILGPRPRLAPSLDDQRAIHRALTAFHPRVAIAAASVMRAMHAALA